MLPLIFSFLTPKMGWKQREARTPRCLESHKSKVVMTSLAPFFPPRKLSLDIKFMGWYHSSRCLIDPYGMESLAILSHFINYTLRLQRVRRQRRSQHPISGNSSDLEMGKMMIKNQFGRPLQCTNGSRGGQEWAKPRSGSTRTQLDLSVCGSVVWLLQWPARCPERWGEVSRDSQQNTETFQNIWN